MKSYTSHSIGKSGNVYSASFRRIQAWRTAARCRGKMCCIDILRRTRDGRRGDVRCRDGRRGDVRCSKSRFGTARYFVGYVRFGRSFVWCRIL